jgi:hypothetical protein
MSNHTTLCANVICANSGKMNNLKLETKVTTNDGTLATDTPLLKLMDTSDVAVFGPILQLQKNPVDSDDTGATGMNELDQCGTIKFVGNNATATAANRGQITYGNMTVIANEVSDGTEAGTMTLSTAVNDGTSVAGLTLTGSAATAGVVDATLGAGATSVVSFPGMIGNDAGTNNGSTGVVYGKTLTTVDPYTESVSALYPLGTQLVYGDRKYRYCQAGGVALTPGKLLQSAAQVGTDHQDLATTVQATAGAYTLSLETAGTDLTENQYAEGYLWINDATGEGQAMKIKSHPAHTHAVDPTCVFTLYDPVVTATDGTPANTQVSICKCPFALVILCPHGETGDMVGVAPRAVQASYYFWAQTNGPCTVLVDGQAVVGNVLVRNLDSDDGSACIEVAAGSSLDVNPVVGKVMGINSSSGEYALVWLQIE